MAINPQMLIDPQHVAKVIQDNNLSPEEQAQLVEALKRAMADPLVADELAKSMQTEQPPSTEKPSIYGPGDQQVNQEFDAANPPPSRYPGVGTEGTVALDLVSGAGKSAAEGVNTLAGILERAARKLYPIPGKGPGQGPGEHPPLIPINTEREGVAQNLGAMGEQMAEFLIPGGSLARVKGLEKAPWLMRLLSGLGESTKAAALAKLHNASNPEAAMAAALGLIPGVAGANPSASVERGKELLVRAMHGTPSQNPKLLDLAEGVVKKGLPVAEGETEKLMGTFGRMRRVSKDALKFSKGKQRDITDLTTPISLDGIKTELQVGIKKAIGTKNRPGVIPDDALTVLNRERANIMSTPRPVSKPGNPAPTRAQWQAQQQQQFESLLQQSGGWNIRDFNTSKALRTIRERNPNNPAKLKALEEMQAKIDLYEQAYPDGVPADVLIEWKRDLNKLAGSPKSIISTATERPVSEAKRGMAQSIARNLPDEVQQADKMFSTAKSIHSALQSSYFRGISEGDKWHFAKYMSGRIAAGVVLGGLSGGGLSYSGGNELSPLYGVAAGAILGVASGTSLVNSLRAHEKILVANAIRNGSFDVAWSIIQGAAKNSPELYKSLSEPPKKEADHLRPQITAMPER